MSMYHQKYHLRTIHVFEAVHNYNCGTDTADKEKVEDDDENICESGFCSKTNIWVCMHPGIVALFSQFEAFRQNHQSML